MSTAERAPGVVETPIAGTVPRLELTGWRECYGVVAGITARGTAEEPFDLGLGTDQPVRRVLERWRDLRLSQPEFGALVVSRQVHGTLVLQHHVIEGGLVIHEGADGHLTRTVGILLAVTVADCVPIYLVDPVRGAIALLHAGWRGVAGRILEQGIEALRELAGSSEENLVMHCGVSICGRCYEVGHEVSLACGAPNPGASGPLDLRAVLQEQAARLGLAKVTISPYCSAHDAGARFFSHRASGGRDGRMVAYLGLLP